MATDVSVPSFSYDPEEFTEEQIVQLKHISDRIRIERENGIKKTLEFAGLLCQAQSVMAKARIGVFNQWVSYHANMSRASAYELIAIYKVFNQYKAEHLRQFQHKALVYLSATTTPEQAVDDAIKLAKKGYLITKDLAQQIAAKYTVDDTQAIVPMGEPCPVCLANIGEEIDEWKQFTTGELRCVHCGHIFGESIGDLDDEELTTDELEAEQKRQQLAKLEKATGQVTLICSRLRIPNFKQMTLVEIHEFVETRKQELAK